MDFLSRLLVKLFLDVSEEPLHVEARARYGVFQGTGSIIGNIALAVLKLIFGWMTNSIALLADAFHTGSDVLTSAVVVVGFRMAKKSADIEHPYGHGRIEPIGTLIISLVLIWAGIEFAHAAYDRKTESGRLLTTNTQRLLGENLPWIWEKRQPIPFTKALAVSSMHQGLF